MAEFPSEPLGASEFFERFLPEAFAEAGLGGVLTALEVPLGVLLEGQGGGEWLLQVEGGRLRVEPGSRAAAAFTVVQSVADWRGALWEGRGGVIGRHAASVFRPGDGTASRIAELVTPSLAALPQLRALSGLIRVALTGGEAGDWALGLMLGPGAIPAEPTTSVTLAAADVDAMVRGDLNPLEAFLGGRVQIAGDLTLLMQIQAIQMQAADAARARRSG